ncbi:MAG: hypothetical protein E6G32_03010 [Actinobacteria bacterium]|nr:MAG: hypothetical protein E6G32_03010 [Actinomycetota bacterium]
MRIFASLVGNKELVREELERPRLFGAVSGTRGGLHRLLITAESPQNALQVHDRSQLFLQRPERAHGAEG